MKTLPSPLMLRLTRMVVGDQSLHKQLLLWLVLPQLVLGQIGRGRARRDELARSILGDTVLPLSGLILLMTMIVWAGIRAGLAPLARMRALVEDRAPNDLAPLKIDASPQELRSLAR